MIRTSRLRDRLRRTAPLVAAAAGMGVLVAAGCSQPCRDMCVRTVACFDEPSFDMASCRQVCGDVKRRMDTRDREADFESFIACTAKLDYSEAPQCRHAFVQCGTHIPKIVWQQTFKGQELGR